MNQMLLVRSSLMGGMLIFVTAMLAPIVEGQSVGEPSSEALRLEARLEHSKSLARHHAAGLKKIEARVEKQRLLVSDMVHSQRQLGVSNASVDEVVRLLHTQRVNLLVDLAGLKARQEVITEAAQKSKQDHSSNRLAEKKEKIKQLIAFAEQEVERLEKLAARQSTTQATVNEAKKAVITLEIQLLSVDDEPLHSLSDSELLNQTMLELAEKSARLQKVEELLSRMYTAQDIDDQLLPAKADLKILRDNLYKPQADQHRALLEQIEELQKQLNEASGKNEASDDEDDDEDDDES